MMWRIMKRRVFEFDNVYGALLFVSSRDFSMGLSRSRESLCGRDAQSRGFFKTPGIPRLCSPDEMTMPSAAGNTEKAEFGHSHVQATRRAIVFFRTPILSISISITSPGFMKTGGVRA